MLNLFLPFGFLAISIVVVYASLAVNQRHRMLISNVHLIDSFAAVLSVGPTFTPATFPGEGMWDRH
jgi:hypothetical protein